MKKLLKKTIFYKWYRAYLDDKSKKHGEIMTQRFLKDGPELLQKFFVCMNSENIICWLDFGTLLGYYREHDFIAHDNDIDVGTFIENQKQINKILLDNGFRLIREYHVIDDGGMEETYQYKSTTIDVFYYRKDGKMMYCNSFAPMRNMTKKRNLNKKKPCKVERCDVPLMTFKKDLFKGCEVFVPDDCKLYLEYNYGKDFMVPRSHFSVLDYPNITFYNYEEKSGCCIIKDGYGRY